MQASNLGTYAALATAAAFSGNNPQYKPWGAEDKRKVRATKNKKARRKRVQASRRKNRGGK